MTQLARESTAHSVLRSRTAAAHEAVDAAFGAFSLAEAGPYRSMLLAHGFVLPPLEALLLAHPGLPAWRSRLSLLQADLAALDAAMPQPAAVGTDWSEPALHGLLYVLEGSRLGGKMMARQVPETMPTAFFGAGHEKGEWRALLSALDERAASGGDAWLAEAVEGASRGFGFYQHAAEHFAA